MSTRLLIMENKEVFAKILDADEVIYKVYKPHRFRFCFLQTLYTELFMLIFLLTFGGVFVSMLTGLFGSEETDLFAIIVLGIVVAVILFVMISQLVGVFARYKNTNYAITNKRVIISSGFIGIDFTSLDLKSITSVDVNVGLFDKMVKPNTGTIAFGFNSIPMNSSKGMALYGFMAIQNPYDAYREIKEIIDNAKQ